MVRKYFSKANFIHFIKRFRKTEMPNNLNLAAKQNGENDKSIQRIDGFWQQIGWKYYAQLQATMEKLVPATSRISLRKAKRNILQLIDDSKKEMGRLRKLLPYGEEAKLKSNYSRRQNTYATSMMEQGRIGENSADARRSSMPPSEDLFSQYERDTTFANEPRYKGRNVSLKFPRTYGDHHSCITTCSVVNRTDLPIAANDSNKVDTPLSVRVTESNIPRDVMISAKNS